MKDTLVIELHYLPCIQYFKTLLQRENILFEAHEHLIKQTGRNRCSIYGANGRQDLIIPLKKKSDKIPVKDLQIAYDENWQGNHFKSIKSAYKSSPYFDYYEDEVQALYGLQEKYLLDFNIKMLEWVCKVLKVSLQHSFTKEYQHTYHEGYTDMRNVFGKKYEADEQQSYMQVFAERHGFIPNLSIIDLIFNNRHGAGQYLQHT